MPSASKRESRKVIIVATFAVALLLGIALGSTLNPQPACAPCPKTTGTVTEPLVTTETTALQVTTTATVTMGVGITTTQVASDRAITLSLSIDENRISTRGALVWRGSTKWQDLPLVCDLRFTIFDPTGRVVHDQKWWSHESGQFSEHWYVPEDAILGVYTLTVVASKEGYASAQASVTFEVY